MHYRKQKNNASAENHGNTISCLHFMWAPSAKKKKNVKKEKNKEREKRTQIVDKHLMLISMKHTQHTTAHALTHTHTHTPIHTWLHLIEGPLLIASLFTNWQAKNRNRLRIRSSPAFSSYSRYCCCCYYCTAWVERKWSKEKCAKTRAKYQKKKNARKVER